MRHGATDAGAAGLFSGWLDHPLGPRGFEQARRGGLLLKSAGLQPDRAHTSLLSRAVVSCTAALIACGRGEVPLRHSWRLNERRYGALEGIARSEAIARFGEERVMAWRRSLEAVPPAAEPEEPNSRAAELVSGHGPAPVAESLADVRDRLVPYWTSILRPDLRTSRSVLVVAHSNSLRALVMHLDDLSPDQVRLLEIPHARPLVFDFDHRLRRTGPSWYVDERPGPVVSTRLNVGARS